MSECREARRERLPQCRQSVFEHLRLVRDGAHLIGGELQP